MALRALLFVEVKGRAAGAPFLLELLGGHVVVLLAVQGVVEGGPDGISVGAQIGDGAAQVSRVER